MKRCPICGSHKVLPYPCKHCHWYFCKKHHAPEKHNCRKYHPKVRKRFRIKVNPFPICFIAFWLLVGFYSYFEKDITQLAYFDFIHGLMYILTGIMAVWSGYKVLRKCDYRARSTLGIFGFRLLSVFMLVGAIVLLFFAFVIGLSAIFVTGNKLLCDLVSAYLIVFSMVLLVVSTYLIFKFEIKSGVIIYHR